MRLAASLLGAALMCAALPARAEGWAVGVGTDFPVQLGARFDYEAPFRLRLNTSLGFLPGPYVDAMNGVLVGVGAYDRATADLIAQTLQSSLVWRTHLGYRPFPKLGLYGDVGYGLVTLGGSATGEELIVGVTGRMLPPRANAETRTFGAEATLHMLDVEVGYVFRVARRFQLRVALGGAFTLASSTHISPEFTPRPAAANAVSELTRAGEDYLNDIFTSYVFTPVLSVGGAFASE